MDFIELLKGILMALVPPHDAEGGHVYKWRLVMAGITGGTVMAVSLHIAWACGFLVNLGLVGFARSDEVANISSQLMSIQAGQIRSEILTTRSIQCKTMKGGDQNALTIITRDLQDALDKYQTMTRKQYQLPDCNAL